MAKTDSLRQTDTVTTSHYKMTSLGSDTSDIETTLSTCGFVVGKENLWVPEMGWDEGNEGAGEDPHDPQYFTGLEMMAWMFGTPNKCWVHLVGEMQAGKSGVINTLIRLVFNSANRKKIHITHQSVFVFTGMNDNSWKQQTKERLPSICHPNIHHHSGIDKVCMALEKRKSSELGFKNILVVLDESHIASASSNQPSIVFSKMRECCPVEDWASNNIRLVTISATDPAAVLGCGGDFKHLAKVLNLRTSDKYQSVKSLRDQKRLHSTFTLKTRDDVVKLVEFIKKTYGATPRYHIIRLSPRASKEEELKEFIRQEFIRQGLPIPLTLGWHTEANAKAVSGGGSSTGSKIERNINDILEVEPSEHTFILIKNMFYAAKTLKDQFCGVLFDRSGAKDDTNCQSLLGRACGYGRSDSTHIFTSLQTVERYITVWSQLKPSDGTVILGTDPKTLRNKMAGLNAEKQGEDTNLSIGVRRTMPLVGGGGGGGSDSGSDGGSELLDYDVKEFPSFKEAVSYSMTLPGGKNHRARRTNEDGFLVFKLNKEEKVWSYDEIEKQEKFKGRANNGVRYYPVYRDTSDRTSVLHVIIVPVKKSN